MASKIKEYLIRGISHIQFRMLGHDKEFENKLAGYNPSSFCAGFEYALTICRGLISQMPDAVEVVRCKDCKHSKLPAVLTQKYGEPGTLTCHNWHGPCNKRNVNQNDFCSYGERRTDDQ